MQMEVGGSHFISKQIRHLQKDFREGLRIKMEEPAMVTRTQNTPAVVRGNSASPTAPTQIHSFFHTDKVLLT